MRNVDDIEVNTYKEIDVVIFRYLVIPDCLCENCSLKG